MIKLGSRTCENRLIQIWQENDEFTNKLNTKILRQTWGPHIPKNDISEIQNWGPHTPKADCVWCVCVCVCACVCVCKSVNLKLLGLIMKDCWKSRRQTMLLWNSFVSALSQKRAGTSQMSFRKMSLWWVFRANRFWNSCSRVHLGNIDSRNRAVVHKRGVWRTRKKHIILRWIVFGKRTVRL